ncbi:substrate-binding periplasmic protein [Rhodoferax aquaticus]|uniref:Transporter substrate-binding domain-containing protein n=1 Tax=Rhodoferax aquaticus TaxID=2527691 RepID=A0A515EJK4_9BURK|nr:transporter substrate-binding domain-containing protein [Rhodoferax aquaticus]QDL52845.1 transporter substrate-binding domain-containing protein [Rhodoferax aquaticus]
MHACLKRIVMVWVVCYSLYGVGGVHAQDAKRLEPLKVAFATGEYRPYTSESMPNLGATTELVTAICNAAGIVPEFVFVPWKRAELNLANGLVFGAFPYSANPARKQQFDFSDELYVVSNALVYYDGNSRASALSGSEELSRLKEYKFGIISGSFAEPRLKQLNIAYESVTTVDQLVQMLRLGRFDIYVDDEATIFDAVNRLFPSEASKFRALAVPFGARTPNGVMVSRSYPNSAAILHRFNEGLAKIKKTGEYDKILAKYYLRKK